MRASSFFLSGLLITVLFNIGLYFTNPNDYSLIHIGALTGLLATVVLVALVSSIQVFGSGFQGETSKLLFGVGAIVNVLFRIDIAGFPVGLGYANNMISAFGSSDLFGLALVTVTIISLMTLVSGVMVLSGGE